MRTRFTTLAALLVCAGCDPGDIPPAPTEPSSLSTTLNALVAFGSRRIGTAPDNQASAYIQGRFTDLSLAQVHVESFQFPRYDVASSQLSITVAGSAATSPGFDVLDGSGTGLKTGPILALNSASASELATIDLTNKIALVPSSDSLTEADQLRNVAAKSALAIIFLSTAPDNLRQLGSVRIDAQPVGPIPAITVGAVDGAAIQTALAAKTTVTATVNVQATSTAQTGNNVVATLPGTTANQIVIGAHYDSWFQGGADNGGGVAALIALADRRRRQDSAPFTLVFVAFDGGALGLQGGYDYLRKHQVIAADPLLAVIDLDVPSVANSTSLGLYCSNVSALDQALTAASLSTQFNLYLPLDQLAANSGGQIPTDIQGFYRTGIPTITTFANAPYARTTGDTAAEVDPTKLATAVDAFDQAIDSLVADPPASFQKSPDPKLWIAGAAVAARMTGDAISVTVHVTDASAKPEAMAAVSATLFHDDFFPAATLSGMTDGSGNSTLQFPNAAASMGTGNRFIHITSGATFPLVERVISVE